MAGDRDLELALRIRADAKQARSELGAVNRDLEVTKQSANALASAIRGVTLGFAAGFSFAEIARASDAWIDFHNRLRLVIDDQKSLGVASADVYRIAQTTSQSLQSTVTVYQRLTQQSEALNLSQKEIARLSETVSKAVSFSGSTAESAAAAMMQFGQALASGVLRGEEFNSVNEQANGVIAALADGLGVAQGKLKEMANDGKLTADVVIKALSNATAFVDEKFATRVKTISAATAELDNAFIKLVGTVSGSQSAGINNLAAGISGLSKLLDSLSDNADVLGKALDFALAMAAGRALAALVGLTAGTIKAIAVKQAAAGAALMVARSEAAEAAATLANAQAKTGLMTSTISATAAATAHAAAQARLAAAQSASAAATVGLSAVMMRLTAVGARVLGFFGGPIGLIATLALSAVAFLDFGDDAKDGMDAAAVATESTAKRVKAATADILQSLSLKDLKAATFDQLTAGAKTLEAQVKAAEEQVRQLEKAANSDTPLLPDFLPTPTVNTDLDQAKANAKALRAALNQVSAEQKDKRFDYVEDDEKYLKTLKDQSAQLEKLSEKEKVLARIRARNGDVNEESSKKLIAEAEALDAKNQKAALDGLNKSLNQEIDKIHEISKKQEAINELKERGIDLNSAEAKQYIARAEFAEREKNAAEAKKKAEHDAASAAADRKRQAEQAAQQEASYIDNLRRQAETLGMTAEQKRAYDLAQQKMTSGGRQLSQIYLEATSAFEKQQQALENADTNAGLEADYLSAIGRETDAALLEISTKYNRLRRDFEKTGNETGKVWAEKLIDVERVKARLDAVQSEMDKSQSAISRAENRINVEREAGLITQTEAQQKLLALRADEIKLIESQIPKLKGLAAEGGAGGEQAQIQLDDYQTRLIELKNTATDLQRALNDGLTEGLNEAIKGLADGTMTLRDAISSLVLSVADSLAQLAAQQLADQALSGIKSLFSGGDAAATAVDSTAQGAAITAASGVGAGLMGSAITSAGAQAAAAMAAAISGAATGTGGTSGGLSALTGLFGGKPAGTSTGGTSGGGFWASLAGLFGGGGAGAGAGFAEGGHVSGPGTGTSDSISAWLSNDEFVTRSAVVRQPGALPFLNDFNRRGMATLDDYARRIRHATGGLAGIPAPAMPAPTLGSMQLAEPSKAQGATVKNAINLYAVQDESAIASMAWGRAGQENYKLYLQRNASEIRSILKI